MNRQNRPDGSHRNRVRAALRELIAALDRRVPHVERLGEAGIAREAAALREEAVMRLEQMRSAEPERLRREAELANARMSDDGGPLPGK